MSNINPIFPNRKNYSGPFFINDSLKTKNDYLINVNKDLEAKIKVIQAKEKQLKLVSAITEDNTDKQYFKNKIDYLIKEIDYCIDRISI